MIKQVEGILKRNEKGDKLKFTGKTNYSKVSMYCYILMNFVSVYPSVDLDDYFV